MLDRYVMQERFLHWGKSGQARLARGKAVVVGMGGLGGLVSILLTRAGVGRLRLIDPDRPAWDNLHRQLLFSEDDVSQGRSKVEAAVRYLGSLNGNVELEPYQEALQPKNALDLLTGADVVIDCLDSARTRFLLNEACLKLRLPLVHAGVVKARGQLLVVLPGEGPCLRCWFPGMSESGDTSAASGIIGPAAACLASLQATEALKLLLGDRQNLLKGMLALDLWPMHFRRIGADKRPLPGCPACLGRYDFLPAD